MRITKEKLAELNARADDIETFVRRFPEGAELAEAVEWCISTLKHDKLQYASWLVTHLFDKPQSVRYAVFAAEQVVGLFEKQHPEDTRPRKAIEAAKAWLENPCEDTKKTAYAAAYATYAAARAAYAAARAAYAAADAAYAAARDAARDAAYATTAADAAYAAADAAYAAAYAARGSETKIRILRYGLTLFT